MDVFLSKKYFRSTLYKSTINLVSYRPNSLGLHIGNNGTVRTSKVEPKHQRNVSNNHVSTSHVSTSHIAITIMSVPPMLDQRIRFMCLKWVPPLRNGGIQWIPMFVRCTHDWELEILLIFFPKSVFIPAPNKSGGQNAMLM